MVTHDPKIAAHTQRTIILVDGLVDQVTENGKTHITQEAAIMKLSEAMRIAWEAILKNKIRSFLTMLGIIIGVAAVIIMVGISAGTEATIQGSDHQPRVQFHCSCKELFSRGGPNQPPQGGGLTFDDASAIENGIKRCSLGGRRTKF